VHTLWPAGAGTRLITVALGCAGSSPSGTLSSAGGGGAGAGASVGGGKSAGGVVRAVAGGGGRWEGGSP
jgi:hypothetical protein